MRRETAQRLVINTRRQMEASTTQAAEIAVNQHSAVIPGVVDAATGKVTSSSIIGVDPFPFTFARETV